MNPESRPDLTTLDRLNRLEAENRRLKRFGVWLTAGVGLLALTSFASPLCKTVWAERFVLKDARGKERMVLDAYSQNHPTVSFHDPKGRPLATLAVGADGTAEVTLAGHEDGAPARLKLAADGRPYLEGSAAKERVHGTN